MHKTNLVPVWTKMTGKGVMEKVLVKSSGLVHPAKKEIQCWMSQMCNRENDPLFLFPAKMTWAHRNKSSHFFLMNQAGPK
jgi:hypothetical protein